MKIAFTFVLATGLLSGCATGGSGGMASFFAPDVVSANERYITLHDPIGAPGQVEKAATAHCARHGRIAQFQSHGGAGFQCGGRNSNLCSTYTCVQ